MQNLSQSPRQCLNFSSTQNFRLLPTCYPNMSTHFKDRLGPERESKCQSMFRAPCPSYLLAAASVIKKIMDAADAEKEQRLHREKEKRREDNSAVGGQEGEEEGERERQRDADHRFHGEQEQLHLDAFPMHHKMALPAQEELTIHRVPPRWPDRPFRKRERRFVCPERYHANHSGRQAYCGWLPREWGRHLMSQGDRATMRTTGTFLKCRKSLVVALNNTDLRLLEHLLLWLLLWLLLLLLLILEMLFFLLLLLLPLCPRTTSVGILSLINRVI